MSMQQKFQPDTDPSPSARPLASSPTSRSGRENEAGLRQDMLAEKNIFKKYNINPKKHLGQNFLINDALIQSLIEEASINKKDTVVEVGAGTGLITKELSRRAGRIYAIEKDKELIPILQKELGGFDNVEIIHGDILKLQIANGKSQIANHKSPKSKQLAISHLPLARGYKLIGAPPYYLTARLFRKFLEEAEIKPQTIALIIQKEVAQKITARPPKSNKLAVSVQLYGEPEIIRIVPKTSFWPQPKVDSALLVVKNIRQPKGVSDTPFGERMFFRVVGAGFSAPRKQLVVNLSRVFHISRQDAAHWLAEVGIEASRRAQTLEVAEWINLSTKSPSHIKTK